MKLYAKRVLSWILAMTLLISCGITGLVLPASAEVGDVLVSEDFEGETTVAALKKWTAKGSVVEDPLNPGNKVLKINSKLNVEYTGKWGLKPDKLYRLTLKVYGGTGVYVRMNTNKGILNDGRTSVNTTAGWTQLTYLVRTTSQYNNFADDAYTISLTAPAGAYVDDVKLVEIEGDLNNLLLGGDFEEDANYYNYAAWKDVVKSGKVVVDPDDANNHVMYFEGFGNRYYNSRVGILPNSTYVLKFKAKGKNLGIYLNAGKGIASNSGWKKVLDAEGSEDWIDYELEFRTKASVDDASYVLAFNLANANNITGLGTPDAYIDDVRLERAPVKEISVETEPLYLGQGASSVIDLTTSPIGSRYDSVEWKSADEELVSVDANGAVTASATKTGETTVTVTVHIGDDTLTATRTVIVVGNADSFELKDEALHLAPGTKQPTIVVATPVGARVGNLTFSSDNEAVATVDASGVITAVAAGTATITVKNADNAIFAEEVKDTLTVTVDEAGDRVSGGTFDAAVSEVTTGGVGTIATDSADRNNKVLKVAASENLVLGGLTLNAKKSYKMTFKARGTDVTVSVANAIAGGGDVKTTLKADAWTAVTRYFTADAAAAVSLKGTANWELDDLVIVELPEATGITMVPSGTLELIPDSTAQAVVTVQPDGAWISGATFTSSDETVVTVTADGKMTLIGKDGASAVITATAKNEKGEDMTAQLTVKVNEYANILNNGAFEQGATSWGSSQTGAAILPEWFVPGAGKDGSVGIVLKPYKEKAVEIFYKGKIPLLPGTTYKLSYDYKTTKSGAVKIWTGTLGFGQLIAGNSGGEWETTSKVFTTPTNLKFNNNWDLGVVIATEADETMAVDNVRLELYSSGVEAESIEMNRKEVRLVPGRTSTLGVIATPSDGDTNMLKWTSSDENVVTVEYGVIKGVGKGTATITATTRNGKKATAKVIVSGGSVLIKNGTFDVANDGFWTAEGTAAIADGVGVKETAAGKIGDATGKLTQSFKGLKPNTSYTLTVRYAGTGNAGILLQNGETKLVEKAESAAATFTTGTYSFTTGETVAETTVLTLSLASGSGPVYFDYVLLSEDATLIDVVVNDVYWITDGILEQEHQVKTGTELQFVVTVLNQGEDPITAGMQFDVEIQLDAETIQTITFTADEDIPTGGIAIVMGTEKWVATAGDHTISANANSTLKILEIDDSNNDYFQKSLRVADELLEIPELAEKAGYDELIFNDEFDNIRTIEVTGAGEAGYKWYIRRPYAGTKLDPDDYEVKDGILIVKNKNSQYNYGMSTIDASTGRGFTFNKGYLEFRLRIPHYDADKEGGPAIWSFPAEKICETGSKPAKQWVEMDWMEYWGITTARPGGHYTISMHETIRGYKADGITVDSSVELAKHSAEGRHKEGFGDGEWHTMAFLWTEDLLIAYTDGEQVYKITYGEGEFSKPLTMNSATEDGTGAFSYMNEQYLALILGGSVDNPMEVDYIRVWSGEGGGYVPSEGDDDEGGEDDEPIYDIAAPDFWNNYCLDDYLEPILPETIDEYSYQYVLMGADVWGLLSEERQAEINALMTENGQPTFPELVEAVEEWLFANPDVLADYFVSTFFVTEDGELITEVTEENYMLVLASAVVFAELDTDVQLLILETMAAYGLPSYEELLAAALVFAEADGVEVPDITIPDTGEVNTVWPWISFGLLFACAVALWATRKRRA